MAGGDSLPCNILVLARCVGGVVGGNVHGGGRGGGGGSINAPLWRMVCWWGALGWGGGEGRRERDCSFPYFIFIEKGDVMAP